jgi:hypothetical protein
LKNEVRVFTHRDLYDKQIIYSGNHTAILDCDNAVSADSAVDYANFLAHLTLRKLQFAEFSDNIEKGREAFIDAYDDHSDDFRYRVEWWKAATLLRLIFLYSYRPKWQKLIGDLIIKSNRILDV